MNIDKWRELGKNVKMTNKLLKKILIESNMLGLTRENRKIASMLNSMIKFKHEAEYKMLNDGIGDTGVFYGEDVFDPSICECGGDIEFCECWVDEREDEEDATN